MKKLFSALGFRKSDEMDVNIQLKSIRISWVFGIVCLAAWVFYENHNARTNHLPVNFIPSMLLISQCLIPVVSQLILRNSMSKDEDEKNPTTWQLLSVVVIALVILVLGILLPRIIG